MKMGTILMEIIGETLSLRLLIICMEYFLPKNKLRVKKSMSHTIWGKLNAIRILEKGFQMISSQKKLNRKLISKKKYYKTKEEFKVKIKIMIISWVKETMFRIRILYNKDLSSKIMNLLWIRSNSNSKTKNIIWSRVRFRFKGRQKKEVKMILLRKLQMTLRTLHAMINNFHLKTGFLLRIISRILYHQ